MSNNKALIRDMVNSLIKDDDEAAKEIFTQISYNVSQSHLGIDQQNREELDNNEDDE